MTADAFYLTQIADDEDHPSAPTSDDTAAVSGATSGGVAPAPASSNSADRGGVVRTGGAGADVLGRLSFRKTVFTSGGSKSELTVQNASSASAAVPVRKSKGQSSAGVDGGLAGQGDGEQKSWRRRWLSIGKLTAKEAALQEEEVDSEESEEEDEAREDEMEGDQESTNEVNSLANIRKEVKRLSEDEARVQEEIVSVGAEHLDLLRKKCSIRAEVGVVRVGVVR